MASEINAGSAFVKLSLKNEMTDGLSRAKAHLQSFAAATAKVGLIFGGLSAAVVGPMTAAVAGLVSKGKIDYTLSLWKQLTDTVQVLAENLATAVAPALDTTLGVVNGIAKSAADWLKNNQKIALMVAKVAVGIGAVGAVAGGLSAAFTLAASALGAIATTSAVLGAVFASPLGIALAIGGAVVAATAAWMRFTSSGRAAAQSLYATFATAITFIRKAVGGIADALAAGDIELAGKVAVTALKVIFLEGVSAINAMMGENFGGFVFAIVKDLKSFKDFFDSWVIGISESWDSVANGMVAAFQEAITGLKQLWKSFAMTVQGTLQGMQAIAQMKGFTSIANALGKGADAMSGASTGGNELLDKIKNTVVGAVTAVKVGLGTYSAGGKDDFRAFDERNKANLEMFKGQLASLEKKAAAERAAMPNAAPIERLQGVATAATTSAAGAMLLASGAGGAWQGKLVKSSEKTASGVTILGIKLDTLTERIAALKLRAT